VQKLLQSDGWHEAEEQMKRFRAARKLPDGHSKRLIWDRLLETTPAWLQPIWRHLPDPLALPGRPKGVRLVTDEMLAEMDRRVATGEAPTAVAKAIVGNVAGQKNRADYLVRIWKRSRAE
jgi:hypothetical protein